MPPLRTVMTALAAAALTLGAACNRGPAEDALKAVEQALGAAKPEIERYAPEELAALTATLQGARAELAKGNYTKALEIAQDLYQRIPATVAVAAAAKEKLAAEWTRLEGRLPPLVESLAERVAALTAAPSLPKGVNGDLLASARSDLASMTQAWSEAAAAFQGGDVPRAVRTARDLEGKAGALAGMLGMNAEAAAAATR